MEFRILLMKVIYWTFFFLGILTILAFWSSMNGWFEKGALLWFSGFWPMTGAGIAYIISERWELGWGALFEGLKFVLFWLYGVLSWPLSYQLYKEAVDYHLTKKWYEERGIRYPDEVVKRESLWEFLMKRITNLLR